MATPFAEVQRVLSYIAGHMDGDVSLGRLGSWAGISPFHLHRVFSQAAGETPRNLTFRLRLGRAAVLLLVTNDSILDVALASGFQNHEVFCRAFQRRFGMTPRAYRKRGFAQKLDAAQRAHHAALAHRVAACLRLYGRKFKQETEENSMNYSITKTELAPQPVLVVRRRVKRAEIAATIADALSRVFACAQQHGIALAGLPFTRYIEMGPGLVTMEPGMRIAGSGDTPKPVEPEGEVAADTLPAGPAAMTTHLGPYESLHEAYAALEQWIEAQGLQRGGPPWESYVTDPAECANPQDWKTEVYWPLVK